MAAPDDTSSSRGGSSLGQYANASSPGSTIVSNRRSVPPSPHSSIGSSEISRAPSSKLAAAPGATSHITPLPPRSPLPTTANMIERALPQASTAQATIEIRQAAARNLPLEDKIFDAVASASVLCSIPDQPRALAESHTP